MDFSRHERPYLAAASKARQQSAALDALYDAAQQLEKHGASIEYFKMHAIGANPFQHIDLTDWHGNARSLRPLITFSRLTETGTASSLYIRLDPSLSNDAIEVFVQLPNLRTLELNGAQIDADGIARLHSSNPRLTISDAAPIADGG